MATEAATQHQASSHHTHLHSINGMPHGLGLLTTVASLPPKYRSRYLSIRTKCEVPLDLSVKPPISPQIVNDVPIATSFTEVYTEEPKASDISPPSILTDASANKQTANTTTTTATVTITKISKPITPPLTPPQATATTTTTTLTTVGKRKYTVVDEVLEDDYSGVDENFDDGGIVERFIAEHYTNPPKMAKTSAHSTTKRENTPTKAPIKVIEPPQPPKSSKSQTAAATAKASQKNGHNKATRKLKFDEETSSPVSGTIIRPLEDITDGTMQYSNGDIDPKYNIVEITEETKAELAAIKNVIGDYVCKLCRIKFDDAFGLARHRCACIVLLEYRCPECGKQFNCPANLASHRRWHKPKKDSSTSGGLTAASASNKKENRNTAAAAKPKPDDQQLPYGCTECGKKFKRQAYLRKHQMTHAKKPNAAKAKPIAADVVAHDQRPSRSTDSSTVMYGGSSRSSSLSSSSNSAASSSSASSQHSYNGHDEELARSATSPAPAAPQYTIATHSYDYDVDSLSDCSTSTTGYGRLQIVESGLTEEENIAAAALTNLRNCASVIQHTTLAH